MGTLQCSATSSMTRLLAWLASASCLTEMMSLSGESTFTDSFLAPAVTLTFMYI